ncbi:MAG: FecR domain-containing protein [Algicola sp.]|nr:FecR domain-containing protein [Algicola sp.]
MSEFDQLIEKYQKGLLEGAQKELMDRWFDSLVDGKQASDWDAIMEEELKTRILDSIRETKVRSLNPEKGKAKWMSIAAAVAVLVACTYFVWNYSSSFKMGVMDDVQVMSSANNISKVILPDGSVVWLKAYSKLSYPENFSGDIREVELEGEALFEVEQNPNRPFVISCGNLKTTVLGTSFNIKGNQDDIEVNVLTGKVALSVDRVNQNVILLPNEMGVFDKKSQSISKRQSAVEIIESVTVGTKYTMKFEDTPMRLVANELEKKFNVNVNFKNNTIENCVITADFSGQTLNEIVHMIGQAMDVEFYVDKDLVVVTGEGCNQ